MPDPRPLASLSLAGFDTPPARSGRPLHPLGAADASQTMPRPPLTTHDNDRRAHFAFPMPTSIDPRTAYVAPSTRRRRRSESPPGFPGTNADSSGGDEIRARRYKRRKLENTPSPSSLKPAIRYGWYGQVEPGRLKMELVSCDGGEHRDPRNPEASLGPENLLRHDKSVYCSESHTVNIVLCHADDRPFCLEKIHIIGPDYGFTAPVQEGLVYVAMTMKELEKYIDSARPAHARRCTRERELAASPELLSLSDALRDPQVNDALEARQTQRQRSATRPVDDYHSHPTTHGWQIAHAINVHEDGNNVPAGYVQDDSGLIANEGSSTNNNHVTFLNDDEEIGPEDSSPPNVLDYRLQRLRVARRRYEIDLFENPNRWASRPAPPPPDQGSLSDQTATSGTTWSRLSTLMARSRVHDSSPEQKPRPTIHRVRCSRSENANEDSDVVWTPFSIQDKKHKVTVKFDPPISGRFVLLKLWANQTNVDVQSVVFYGYGGCRFFPAVKLR